MNTSKIDIKGNYLPFMGYTVVSFCNYSQNRCFKKISNLIETSILKEYYSPLPSDTYHMTLYNIWCQGRPLPKKVEHLAKYFSDEDSIFYKSLQTSHAICSDTRKFNCTVKEFYSGPVIGVKVNMCKKGELQYTNIRSQLKQVFGDSDSNLIPHITFAYMYRPIEENDKKLVSEALRQIMKILKSIGTIHMNPCMTCKFENMKIYKPMSRRSDFM